MSIQAGDSLKLEDVKGFLGGAERYAVCVDWGICDDELFMLVLRPDEMTPIIHPISISVTEV